MLKLLDGPNFDVGQVDMDDAISQLYVVGGGIDLTGASGPLTFDPVTGAGRNDWTFWCIGADPADTELTAPFILQGEEGLGVYRRETETFDLGNAALTDACL
jgi:hypothetical protein